MVSAKNFWGKADLDTKKALIVMADVRVRPMSLLSAANADWSVLSKFAKKVLTQKMKEQGLI